MPKAFAKDTLEGRANCLPVNGKAASQKPMPIPSRHIIPSAIKPEAGKVQLRDIPLTALKPSLHQPRTVFEPESLQRLADTLKRVGVLEPLIIRPVVDSPQHYEIIAGERRWRAAQLAQLPTVPCLVKSYDDLQARQIALIENTAREGLNPIDEAVALRNLLSEGKYTHEEVAAIVGQSRSNITNRLRLLNLDRRIQTWLQQGELSEAHGCLLAGVPKTQQYPLARQCVQGKWAKRRLAAEIKKHLHPVKAPVGNASENSEDRYLKRLEQKLSDHLGYTVEVEYKANQKGYLHVAFADLDHLQGILEKWGYREE